MSSDMILLSGLIMAAAFLYSFVGHGGASGYLMVMALVGGISTATMASTALLLNIVVTAVGLVSWYRVRALKRSSIAPLILASVPCAFIGASLKVEEPIYDLLLGISLAIVGADMLLHASRRLVPEEVAPADGARIDQVGGRVPARVAWPLGGGIGMLSGIIGIGGGVILSPALVHGKWMAARAVAATSCAFVFANSVAGVAGRAWNGTLSTDWLLWVVPFAAAAGIAGSMLGSRHAPPVLLVRVLAVVVLLAGSTQLIELAR